MKFTAVLIPLAGIASALAQEAPAAPVVSPSAAPEVPSPSPTAASVEETPAPAQPEVSEPQTAPPVRPAVPLEEEMEMDAMPDRPVMGPDGQVWAPLISWEPVDPVTAQKMIKDGVVDYPNYPAMRPAGPNQRGPNAQRRLRGEVSKEAAEVEGAEKRRLFLLGHLFRPRYYGGYGGGFYGYRGGYGGFGGYGGGFGGGYGYGGYGGGYW